LIALLGDRPLAPGDYIIATFRFLVVSPAVDSSAEVGFADVVEHLVDPNQHGFQSPDGLPVFFKFTNIVHPGGGDDLYDPDRTGAAVSVSDGLRLAIRAAAAFLRSDADSDQLLGLTGAVFTLGYLFTGGRQPTCLDAADANDDGQLTITDPIRTLQFLFLGGSFLPPPGVEPGEDPTQDSLDCLSA